MRTIPSGIVSALKLPHTIAAYARAYENRLKFVSYSGNNVSVSNCFSHDISSGGTGFVRIASVGSGVTYYLYYQYVPDPFAEWPAWVNTGVQLKPNSKPSVFCSGNAGTIFIQASDDYIKAGAFTISGSSLSITGWTNDFQDAGTFGLAGLSASIYGFVKVVEGDVYYINTLGHKTVGGTRYDWNHVVYSDEIYTTWFDAEIVGTKKCFFVTEGNGGRSVLVTHENDIAWSMTTPVVPIDITDDTGWFRVTGVSNINSLLFISGKTKRPEVAGGGLNVYMIGPDNATQGRNYVVSISETGFTARGGNMVLVNDVVWYISGSAAHYAPSVRMTGKSDGSYFGINDLTIGENDEGMTAEFNCDTVWESYVYAGAEIEIRFTVNSSPVSIGIFGVDRSSRIDDTGSIMSVSCTGVASKSLRDHTFDAYYDYWSQAKQSAEAGVMSEYIRTSGKYASGSSIAPSMPNVSCIAHTSEIQSRNMTQRGRFAINSTGSLSPGVGVFVCYFQSAREKVTGGDPPPDMFPNGGSSAFPGRIVKPASDADTNGILIIYGENQHEGSNGFGTYMCRYGVYTKLNSVPYFLGDGEHWFEATFEEGVLKFRVRGASSTTWFPIADQVLDVGNVLPWFYDDQGKGALLVRNITPSVLCFPFSSDNDIVPVSGFTAPEEPPFGPNSVFPTPSTAIIDGELMTIASKSPDINLPDRFTVVDGNTWPCAPHNNLGWINGVVFREEGTGDVDQNFADTNSTVCIARSITSLGCMTLNSVTFRIRKVGSPSGNLYCHLCNDDLENGAGIDWSSLIATASVPASTITTEYQEITFTYSPTSLPKENYWFMLTRAAGSGANVIDPDNYYQIEMVYNETDNTGIIRLFTTSGWVALDPENSLPFYAIGKSTGGDGYEVYVDHVGSSVARNAYDNMALLVMKPVKNGSGEIENYVPNGCYRITDYDYRAPAQWIANQSYLPPDTWQDHIGDVAHGSWVHQDKSRVFVSEDPSLEPGDEFRIVRALVVSERGYNDTSAVAHGSTTEMIRLSVYTDQSNYCYNGVYYTHNPDLSTGDMVTKLARKCGVNSVSISYLVQSLSFSHSGWALTTDSALYGFQKNSIICKVNRTAGELGLWIKASSGWVGGHVITFSSSMARFYRVDGPTSVTELDNAAISDYTEITISVFDDFVCAWSNGRLLCFFVCDYLPWEDNLMYMSPVSNGAASGSFTYPELDKRIDNFVFEMGSSGQMMMRGIVGEKKVYLQENQTGGLKAFQNRVIVNSGDANTMVEKQELATQDAMTTILRVEGVDVAEAIDIANISGNYFFRAVTRNEPNSRDEINQEAKRLLAELKLMDTASAFSGVPDLRVQPNDIFILDSGDEKTVVVDQNTIQTSVTESEVTFTMDIEAHDAS